MNWQPSRAAQLARLFRGPTKCHGSRFHVESVPGRDAMSWPVAAAQEIRRRPASILVQVSRLTVTRDHSSVG